MDFLSMVVFMELVRSKNTKEQMYTTEDTDTDTDTDTLRRLINTWQSSELYIASQ